MEKNYKVYVHTNKANNKKYVGITCQIKPEYRWNSGNGYKHQEKFYNAILKYGWDNFTHEILESNLNLNEAIASEEKYIKLFNSYNDGYNSCPKGDATSKKYGENIIYQYSLNGEFINEWHSVYEIELMLGIRRDMIIKVCNGERKSIGGYIFKFEKECKPYDSVWYNSSIRRCYVYNSEGIFLKECKNIKDASQLTHVSERSILRVYNGERKTAGGYYFSKEYVDNKPKILGKRTGEKICQYDKNGNLIAVFNNLNSVKEKGFYTQRIANCCKRRKAFSYGYVWRYYGEPF